MKVIFSKQLIKSIYLALLEAEKVGEKVVGVDFLLLGLLTNKKSLAYKIYSQLYKNPDQTTKILKEKIYEYHKTNSKEKSFSEEYSLTPAFQNLLFKLLFKASKNKEILSTKEVFFILLRHKRLSTYLRTS